MKVMHFIQSLEGGGAERQLCYLSKGLVEHGVDNYIVYIRDGVNGGLARESGANLIQLKANSNYDPRILSGLISAAADVKPDVIQVWLPQMTLLGAIVSAMLGIPFILSERNSSAAYKNGIIANIRKVVGRRAAAIVANSNEGIKYWQRASKVDVKCVIPNCVDLEAIEAVGGEFPVDKSFDGKTIVVFAGRFHEQKNVRRLFQAFKKLVNRDDDILVVMYGEGPIKDEIVREIEVDNIKRIRVKGYTTKLFCILKQTNLFVSTSLYEGSPNTVKESMAAGCLMVISDIPEHREVVPEKAAFFANPYSVESIEEAMWRALCDDGAKDKIRLAKDAVRGCSYNGMAKKYLKVYNLVVNLNFKGSVFSGK